MGPREADRPKILCFLGSTHPHLRETGSSYVAPRSVMHILHVSTQEDKQREMERKET